MAALLGRGRAAALAFARRHNRFKSFCYASSTSCKLEQPAINENSSSMYERSLPFSRTYNTSSPFPAFINGKYRHSQKLIPEVRYFASGADGTVDVLVPSMGESITDGTVAAFLKKAGESVAADDIIAQIETDKVTVDVRTPEGGVVEQLLANVGDTVQPGRKIAVITKGETASATVTGKTEPVGTEPQPSVPSPPPQASVSSVPPSAPPKSSESPPKPPQIPVEMKARHPAASEPILPLKDKERRVPMTRLRKRVAARLKDSQNTFALLTTFNEIDMTNLMQLRSKYKDAFQERHGVKLGFMSAFVKAAVSALEQQAVVNAVIDGDDIIYRDYVDISIAVATPKGLVVPVIRGADRLNFAEIEKTIADLGKKAKDGTISIDDMAGGTFTISNGGVYGSVLSTPIINPPQSAILGMHKVISRATVIGENIVPRPIMNVALTYDHRLIDGREAVLFLSRIKDVVEDPSRLLLDV